MGQQILLPSSHSFLRVSNRVPFRLHSPRRSRRLSRRVSPPWLHQVSRLSSPQGSPPRNLRLSPPVNRRRGPQVNRRLSLQDSLRPIHLHNRQVSRPGSRHRSHRVSRHGVRRRLLQH